MRRKVLDIGEAPLYGLPEAAVYLDIPITTLRSWISGRVYPTTARGSKFFHPLIDIADTVGQHLSFFNLIEAHVISTFRVRYKIPIPKIRDAMDYLRVDIQHKHPLVTEQFYLYGKDIIIKRLEVPAGDKVEVMINASRKGQLGITEVLEIYLRRIKRAGAGMPVQLHPLRRNLPLEQTEVIEINPNVAFGNPVVKGTGVTVAMILDRYRYGRSVGEIADDYNLDKGDVKTAVEYYKEAA